MKKIKNLLFSEKGMRMVNVLFFLSAFFYKWFVVYSICCLDYLSSILRETDRIKRE